MLISMSRVKTEDGAHEYWAPHLPDGTYDERGVRTLDDLGYPPDTAGWDEPPDVQGWYDYEVIGGMILDAVKAGHSIVFHR